MTKQIKITRAGYLYINGIKATELRITPLQIPVNLGPDAEQKAREWVVKNYRMA